MSEETWKLNTNIKVIGKRGNRTAISNSNLKSDFLLLQANPFGICVHYEYRKEMCLNCFSIGKMSVKCKECWASYCSKECVDFAKEFHSINECRHFNSLLRCMKEYALDNPWEYSRFQLVNIGLWILNFCLCCQYLNSLQEYQVLQELVSNLDSIPDHEHSQYAYLYELFSKSSFKTLFLSIFNDLTYFKQIMCIRQCNGFGLWVEDELMGMALYPMASFFDHSCDPNIIRVSSLNSVGSLNVKSILNQMSSECSLAFNTFYPKNVFKTLKDVPMNAPLYHSYIDTNLSYDKRQDILQTVFLFTCECSKCIKERDQV